LQGWAGNYSIWSLLKEKGEYEERPVEKVLLCGIKAPREEHWNTLPETGPFFKDTLYFYKHAWEGSMGGVLKRK